MDWKSFIASIISSLAWPMVAGAFLYVFRKELPRLVRRIKGATIAGTKLEFEKALDDLRKEAEVAAVDSPRPTAVIELKPQRLRLAEDFPEAAVMEAFKSVEARILDARKSLDLPPRSNLRTIVHKLVEARILDSEAEPMFYALQRARNTAAHGGTGERISPAEAIEFMGQARFFEELVASALKRLEDH